MSLTSKQSKISKHFYYFFYFLWEVYKRLKFGFALIFSIRYVPRIDIKKLGIYFNFDCCTYFIPTTDLCYFHLSHILWQLSWHCNFYFALFRSTMSGNARSSHRRCSVRKGSLRNFRKHLCQSLFFNTVKGQPFLQSTCGRLLLKCLKKKISKRK